MIPKTPHQLGLTPEHITQVVRSPRLFSMVVKDQCSDVDVMRQKRDALHEGVRMVNVLTLMCQLDQESVLKQIEQPQLLEII
jgi:hypothetical protein